MKLDRNKNPDGRGKYALVQMRELGPDESELLRTRAGDEEKMITLPASAFRTGAESPGDMFFVLKYKDRFAAAALFAYPNEVMRFARGLTQCQHRDELMEYGDEVLAEANLALHAGHQIPT